MSTSTLSSNRFGLLRQHGLLSVTKSSGLSLAILMAYLLAIAPLSAFSLDTTPHAAALHCADTGLKDFENSTDNCPQIHNTFQQGIEEDGAVEGIAPVFNISASSNVIFVPGSATLMLKHGEASTITITVTDPDAGEEIQLRIVQIYDQNYSEVEMFENASLSPALPLSGTGTLSTELRWSPTYEQWGHQEMQLVAEDASGNTVYYTLYFMVNILPEIIAPAAVTVPVGEMFILQIPVIDDYGTLWTGAMESELPLMGFETTPGIQIIGEVGPEYIGTHELVLLAWDESGMQVSEPMLIHVVADCNMLSWYPDADGDGYGEEDEFYSIDSCTPIAGYASEIADCNDSDAGINPGAEEIPDDGKDNNCNGETDEEEVVLTCRAAQPLKLWAQCPDVASQRKWMIYNPNSCAVEVMWQVHKTSQQGNLVAPPGRSYFTTLKGNKNNDVVFIHWTDTQGKSKKKGMASASAPCKDKGKNTRITNAEHSLKAGLAIYPVPFQDQLRVEHQSIKAGTAVKVALISLDGRTLDVSAHIIEQAAGQLLMNLQQLNLSNGLYILRLQVAGEEPVFTRVIRQQ